MMVTHDELTLTKTSFPIMCMVFIQAMDLSQTILASSFLYSHLSLKSIRSDGLTSSIATSCLLNIFSLSHFEVRELPFQTTNTCRTGIGRRLELGRIGSILIQLRK